MTSRPRTGYGLAARIVRVTLLLGGTIILVAGIVALMSTSRLASERAAANDLVALRLLDGAVEERLRAIDGVMDRAGTLVAASSGADEAESSVGTLFSGSRALFDEMLVTEINGSVQLAVPRGYTPRQVRSLPAFHKAVGGSTGFSSVRVGDVFEIWVTRTAVNDANTPIVILARLDSGFVSRALARAVRDQPDRIAVLLDGGQVLGYAGLSSAPDFADAEWTTEGTGLGQVRFVGPGNVAYSGYYDDLASTAGVSWRAISANTVGTDTLDTVRAVAPSVVVLVLGGLVTLAFAWGTADKLVRPLRDLERTAKSAAAGAYVKPLPHVGDDEIGRVADAFNQVALRLNSLHDLSQLLASAAKLDQVLDGILLAVGHIVGPGAAAIYLLDDTGQNLIPVRTRGSALAEVRPVPLSRGGKLVEALNGSGPMSITGSHEAVAHEIPGLGGTTSGALAAPLVAGNETMGLVVILQYGGTGVSEAEREMVRTFSAQAAVAVQTSRLFEVESESRQVAEVLRAVAEQLVHPRELRFALDVVEVIIRDFFGANVVHLILSDPGALGLQDTVADETLEAAMSLAHLAAGSENPWMIVEQGDHAGAHVLLKDRDDSRLMVVPISLESEHAGVLLAGFSSDVDEGKLRVAGALADEIALALDNAYFFERALTRATNLETIFRISQAVASSLQVNVVLNRVLDVVQKILVADAVLLWLYDPVKRALGTAMVRGDVPAHLVGLELGPGEDLPGRVFASKEPVLVRDLTPGMGGVAGSVASQRMGSLLAVPLLARGRAIGVLMVLSTAPDAFGEEDANMLQTFASQAALAIDTARLYGNEHQVASTLQQSILPSALPDFPEVEAGSVYAPAGKEAEIGGDYYDLLKAPDGCVWFAIADVCGKGVVAATKTSMIKYAVRAFIAAGLSPGRILVEVNRMACEAGESSDIVTLWLGRYDASARLLTWANGGHPPAVVRRADGSEENLATTGPLLGALSDVGYTEQSTSFGPGDRVLLHTDGVNEARSGNVFFGDERAAAEVTLHRTPQEDAEALLSAVKAYVAADLRDDVAVLVLAARDVSNDASSGKDRT